MLIAKLRYWWLITAIAVGSAIGIMSGGLQFLWNADQTKITFLMLAVFLVTTVFIGWMTIKERHTEQYIDACWFTSDALMRLGILTTVTGFILMFHGAIGHLDLSNADNVRKLVVSISTGLTTALVGTLVGVATSMLVGVQLKNLEVGADETKA